MLSILVETHRIHLSCFLQIMNFITNMKLNIKYLCIEILVKLYAFGQIPFLVVILF